MWYCVVEAMIRWSAQGRRNSRTGNRVISRDGGRHQDAGSGGTLNSSVSRAGSGCYRRESWSDHEDHIMKPGKPFWGVWTSVLKTMRSHRNLICRKVTWSKLLIKLSVFFFEPTQGTKMDEVDYVSCRWQDIEGECLTKF